jgi:hypothetical protein
MGKTLASIRAIKQRCLRTVLTRTAMKELATQLRLIYLKVRSAVGQISGRK